jgi:hypothetical protein
MILDTLGLGLRLEQTILDHADQQLLCGLLQGNGCFGLKNTAAIVTSPDDSQMM